MTFAQGAPKPKRRHTAAIVAMTVIAAAGCGTADSERDAATTVERFQAALVASDGHGACAKLTAATRAAVASRAQRPCERAILQLDLPDEDHVIGSDVYLTSAVARLAGGERAFLDQTPDGWRISAAGCTPTLPDRPLDCELES